METNILDDNDLLMKNNNELEELLYEYEDAIEEGKRNRKEYLSEIEECEDRISELESMNDDIDEKIPLLKKAIEKVKHLIITLTEEPFILTGEPVEEPILPCKGQIYFDLDSTLKEVC